MPSLQLGMWIAVIPGSRCIVSGSFLKHHQLWSRNNPASTGCGATSSRTFQDAAVLLSRWSWLSSISTERRPVRLSILAWTRWAYGHDPCQVRLSGFWNLTLTRHIGKRRWRHHGFDQDTFFWTLWRKSDDISDESSRVRMSYTCSCCPYFYLL